MADYIGHDQWTSFLQHSGTKGMRWGYTDGHLNGNRTAQGEKEEPAEIGHKTGGDISLGRETNEEDARKLSAEDLFKVAQKNGSDGWWKRGTTEFESGYTGTVSVTIRYGPHRPKKGQKAITRYVVVENGQVKTGTAVYDSKDQAQAAARATATSQNRQAGSNRR